MTVVTGVSGSGKSTLVNDILYRALARELYGSREEPGEHDRITGADNIDKASALTSRPLAARRAPIPPPTPEYSPPSATCSPCCPSRRQRGYKAGRFSFNVAGGRCEACQGDGQRRIEMNFLPDVYVQCEVCNGRRYNQETLAVKFKGHSIADILELTIADALPVLTDIPRRGRNCKRWWMSGSATSTSASPRPPFPAAKRSA
jgi:excinuclease ABC subunit A